MFSSTDRILIIKVTGELDHHRSDELRYKIEREMSFGNYIDIVFDFSDLSFMDSSGIGLIMGRYRNAEALGGRIAIAAASPDICRLIDISGLYKLVRCHDSTAEAVKALKAAQEGTGRV